MACIHKITMTHACGAADAGAYVIFWNFVLNTMTLNILKAGIHYTTFAKSLAPIYSLEKLMLVA